MDYPRGSYAYASAAGNNGSAFAGLNANTSFYNGTLALAMLLGRFGVIIPVLGIAGSMARKSVRRRTPGHSRRRRRFCRVAGGGAFLLSERLPFSQFSVGADC